MNRIDRAGLAAICWLGVALRYRGLFANRFHADEALFAGWARLIAVWRDPLLATQPLDKPPLPFYLQALFYPLIGPEEWAARLPSFIASLLLIPLTAQLARRLTGDRAAALVAAAVVAVAPLAVQFSATAFGDPLLAFWLTAALYTAARRDNRERAGQRYAFLAGLLFGLALATKYQALLFLPLIVGLAAFAGWRRWEWRRGLAGLAVVVAALVVWSAARPASGGLVSLQWDNVGGLRPARSWELLPRLSGAARLGRFSLGRPLAGLGLAAGLLLMGPFRRRLMPVDAALILFVLAYLLLHWLWAVPVWDRYLLPILPLVAILLGRGLSLIWSALEERPTFKRAFAAIVLMLVAAQLAVAAGAREGRYPIGGRPAADGGASQVAQLLEDAPYGTVLYDHWYSWHWRYQLFDGRVYVSWFPHTDALLADLAAFGGSGPARYVALPRDGSAAPVQRRLGEAGYRLVAVPGPAEAAMGLWRIESEATDE